MVLSDSDRALFYRLNWHLLFYASRELEFLPRPGSPADIEHGPDKDWMRLRDGLYEHPNLFDRFTDSNPDGFPPDELAIVRSWRGFKRGEFFVWRYLKKYTVFLDDSEPGRAYGVLALNKPFQFMLGSRLPVAIEAVLLPFKNMIVYDGLFSSYKASFGPGIRRVLNDVYREAKAREGIVTSLVESSPALKLLTAGDRAAGTDGAAIRFRYWYGFTKRLPYDLDSLKQVTDADVVPGRLDGLAACAREERVLRLPTEMGIAEGFDPIQVNVLELEMGGWSKRIEVLNRGGSLFLARKPANLQRFQRFVYAIEKALPAAKQPLL